MLKIVSSLQENRKFRIALALCAGAAAAVGALYLYHHDPYSYPLPCLFYLLTGLYCPGCGAGRACYSILHLRFADAFCYNPLMTVLLPLIGIYIVVRGLDWVITGRNHVDSKISVRFLVAILTAVIVYGVLRNIPAFPFTLLAPGGLVQIW
ncbi:MAG TPA: DUF2752 domain-containing protein [Candidatus Mediterraneibacter surreyensis]|nr:DUF2752 domain-containing protein [Candidatus Mediterraneibacter surreyensis]